MMCRQWTQTDVGQIMPSDSPSWRCRQRLNLETFHKIHSVAGLAKYLKRDIAKTLAMRYVSPSVRVCVRACVRVCVCVCVCV